MVQDQLRTMLQQVLPAGIDDENCDPSQTIGHPSVPISELLSESTDEIGPRQLDEPDQLLTRSAVRWNPCWG